MELGQQLRNAGAFRRVAKEGQWNSARSGVARGLLAMEAVLEKFKLLAIGKAALLPSIDPSKSARQGVRHAGFRCCHSQSS